MSINTFAYVDGYNLYNGIMEPMRNPVHVDHSIRLMPTTLSG